MPERTEDESLQYLAELLVDMFFEQEEVEKMRNASPAYIQEFITRALRKEGFRHITYSSSDDEIKSFAVSVYDPSRRINEVSKKFVVKTVAESLWESCWMIGRKVDSKLGRLRIEIIKKNY